MATQRFTLHLDLPIFLLGVVVTITMVKLTQFLPGSLYFSFTGLVNADSSMFVLNPSNLYAGKLDPDFGVPMGIAEDTPPMHWLAIVIKLALPFLVGIGLGYVAKLHEVSTIGSATLCASILLWWPMALLWYELAPYEVANMRLEFLGLYVVYSLAYFFLGRAGAGAGLALRQRRRQQALATGGEDNAGVAQSQAQVAVGRRSVDFLLGIGSSIAATWLTDVVGASV